MHIQWTGSLRGLLAADALAVIPAGEQAFTAGDLLDVLPLEDRLGEPGE